MQIARKCLKCGCSRLMVFLSNLVNLVLQQNNSLSIIRHPRVIGVVFPPYLGIPVEPSVADNLRDYTVDLMASSYWQTIMPQYLGPPPIPGTYVDTIAVLALFSSYYCCIIFLVQINFLTMSYGNGTIGSAVIQNELDAQINAGCGFCFPFCSLIFVV